jgi:hypothetical protein
VTGNPTSSDFLRAQIVDAVDRAIRPALPSGAVVRYGSVSPDPQPLAPGFETTFSVPVTVAGGAQTASVSGVTSVSVQNLAAATFTPAILFFDDDPERIGNDGVLFRGTIDAQRPARLYYYHENTGTQRRLLVLLSSADQPAQVQIVGARGGPDADVMGVGHSVSRSFLLVKPAGEGIVVDIARGQPFRERDVPIAPSEVIAGALDVHVLMGGSVTLTVLAIPPDADPMSYATAPRVQGDGHNRHGTFALGEYGQTIVAYTVGGPDASVVYADRARQPQNLDPSDAGSDFGDYGVLRQIVFDVNNPTDAPAALYLYERPLGGGVRSSFLVDGVLHDIGCARLTERYLIDTVQLAARTNSEVHVWTMTDGGSSYPLEVGITPTPPLPTTPPLSAPEGCFPK